MAKMLTSEYVSGLSRDLARTCKQILLTTGASVTVTPVVEAYKCKIIFTLVFPDADGKVIDKKVEDFVTWSKTCGLGNITKDDLHKVVVDDDGKSFMIVGAIKGKKPIVLQDMHSRNLVKVSLKDAHKYLHRQM